MDVADCQPDFCLDIYEPNNKRKKFFHFDSLHMIFKDMRNFTYL